MEVLGRAEGDRQGGQYEELVSQLPHRLEESEIGLGEGEEGAGDPEAATSLDGSSFGKPRRVSLDVDAAGAPVGASGSRFSRRGNSYVEEACVIQFATAVFYCDESEGHFNVDIVRIGPAHLPVRVYYMAENGSAIAGVNFEDTVGEVVFEPGVIMKTVAVNVLPSHIWNPTLDLSMKIWLDPDVEHARLTYACAQKLFTAHGTLSDTHAMTDVLLAFAQLDTLAPLSLLDYPHGPLPIRCRKRNLVTLAASARILQDVLE